MWRRDALSRAAPPSGTGCAPPTGWLRPAHRPRPPAWPRPAIFTAEEVVYCTNRRRQVVGARRRTTLSVFRAPQLRQGGVVQVGERARQRGGRRTPHSACLHGQVVAVHEARRVASAVQACERFKQLKQLAASGWLRANCDRCVTEGVTGRRPGLILLLMTDYRLVGELSNQPLVGEPRHANPPALSMGHPHSPPFRGHPRPLTATRNERGMAVRSPSNQRLSAPPLSWAGLGSCQKHAMRARQQPCRAWARVWGTCGKRAAWAQFKRCPR